MRLIDGDALIAWIKESQHMTSKMRNIICKVETMPSADRPQGEWIIEKTLYDNYNYRCSYCDWYECHAYPDVEPYNYCPNCGCRMKGADDE